MDVMQVRGCVIAPRQKLVKTLKNDRPALIYVNKWVSVYFPNSLMENLRAVKSRYKDSISLL